ncbi:MAG TPA: hypothetical protein VF785_06460 [Gemmatimonadaceae bacterium]
MGLRIGADTRGFGRVQTKTPPSTDSGVVVLSDDWISVDPWMTKVSKAEGIAQLQALALAALEFVDQ